MRRWYVVQTKFMQEETAYRELKRQKFTTFYPTFVKERERAGKIIKQIIPLFPTYIFVQFDIDRHKRWKSIHYTRGVKQLIGLTDQYLSPLPIGCVEEIMSRTAPESDVIDDEVAVMDRLLDLKPQAKLLVTKGAFAGNTVTYCNHSENRVVVLLTLLNTEAKLKLPLDSVQNPTSGY